MDDIKARALAIFPAGVSNGEYGLPAQDIVVMERGEGARLWDTDGQEFIDFSVGWGSNLVGHANPEVAAAVREQAGKGSNFAYLNRNALEVAEEISRVVACAERIRFCASGTEATMYCMRLARAHSGKPKILKFEGAYHGANLEGVSSLFPQRLQNFPQPEATSAGTPSVKEDLLVAPFNDIEATRSILKEHAHEIAGVIVEPLQRCTPPLPGFLQGLRETCTQHGIVLIFDEVVTGFRLAYGGAQEYYGVTPDLAAFGKALGGGYPIGAFTGRSDLMQQMDEARIGGGDYVWMASTLGGNPVSMAAARAALGVLRQPGTYERLHATGAYLRERAGEVVRSRGLPVQMLGDGPMAQIVFTSDPVRDYRSGLRADKVLAREVMLGLFRRQVFLNPMGTKLYVSLAHDRGICDAFCDRLDDSLAQALKTRAA
ncbi:MAG: aspartate aminotransferase family protein [Pseudomonadota bacterium]|nr:aspartate aminotransferase family protein [Pseudomonadota bacterium]